MTIRSMWGSSSIEIPGFMNRLGPAKLTGEALCVICGSVKILKPSNCKSKVECPIQVKVGSMRLFFKKTGSFSARGNAKGSGETLFHCHFSNSEKGFSIESM